MIVEHVFDVGLQQAGRLAGWRKRGLPTDGGQKGETGGMSAKGKERRERRKRKERIWAGNACVCVPFRSSFWHSHTETKGGHATHTHIDTRE